MGVGIDVVLIYRQRNYRWPSPTITKSADVPPRSFYSAALMTREIPLIDIEKSKIIYAFNKVHWRQLVSLYFLLVPLQSSLSVADRPTSENLGDLLLHTFLLTPFADELVDRLVSVL